MCCFYQQTFRTNFSLDHFRIFEPFSEQRFADRTRDGRKLLRDGGLRRLHRLLRRRPHRRHLEERENDGLRAQPVGRVRGLQDGLRGCRPRKKGFARMEKKWQQSGRYSDE